MEYANDNAILLATVGTLLEFMSSVTRMFIRTTHASTNGNPLDNKTNDLSIQVVELVDPPEYSDDFMRCFRRLTKISSLMLSLGVQSLRGTLLALGYACSILSACTMVGLMVLATRLDANKK